MRTHKTPKFEAGDKVAYSVQFLKSIGMSHSEMAHARGIVEAIETHGTSFVLVKINWQGADIPERVLAANLAKVGPNPRFCNVD